MSRNRNRTQQQPAPGTPPVDDTELAEPAEGMVFMVVPEGSTGCSFAGVSYPADEEGFVEVPLEAVATLADHGFTLP